MLGFSCVSFISSSCTEGSAANLASRVGKGDWQSQRVPEVETSWRTCLPGQSGLMEMKCKSKLTRTFYSLCGVPSGSLPLVLPPERRPQDMSESCTITVHVGAGEGRRRIWHASSHLKVVADPCPVKISTSQDHSRELLKKVLRQALSACRPAWLPGLRVSNELGYQVLGWAGLHAQRMKWTLSHWIYKNHMSGVILTTTTKRNETNLHLSPLESAVKSTPSSRSMDGAVYPILLRATNSG